MLGLLAVLGAPLVPAPEPVPTPASIELRWNAPPGCSSAEAIASRIEALLSGPPGGAGEATVVADVVRGPGGVHMTLSTTFGEATDVREVNSASCEALAEATAVLLAISLEPGLEPARAEPAIAKPTLEPESAPASEPEPVPAAPRSTSPESDADAARGEPQIADRPRVRAHGFVAGGVEWGAVADSSAAVTMGLGLRGGRRPWTVEVGGGYVVPRRHPEGLHQVGAALVRGCWTPRVGAWQGLLCGGGEFGLLRVDSRGLNPPQTVQGPSLGPSASLGALWQHGRLGLFVRTEAVVLLSRSRTTTAEPDPQERTAQRPVSLRLLLGARFDFTAPDGR